MGNWFPIRADLLECPEYQSLSKSEKLYYVTLISEYNFARVKHPVLIKSDIWFAATLSLSVITIRKARRKFVQLGLIQCKPGFMTVRGGVATKYFTVKFARVENDKVEGEAGIFFAQVPRFSFNAILYHNRIQHLRCHDVLVWLAGFFLFRRYQGNHDKNWFFATKSEIGRLSGLSDTSEVAASVKRLYDSNTFSGGNHLFNYTDEYHRIVFTDWHWWGEPETCENNRDIALTIENDIERRIKALDNPKKNLNKPKEKKKRKRLVWPYN